MAKDGPEPSSDPAFLPNTRMRAGVFSSLGPFRHCPPNFLETTERPSARRALVRKEAPQDCSSDSQSEPVRWSSLPRKRRGRSSTTTSAPSTSCSAFSVRRRAWPPASSSPWTSPSSACARRWSASWAPARRSPRVRSRSRRVPRRCWSSALREALSLGHNYIGTEHILLGLVRENEGVAARILLDFDADSEKIRNEVIRMLSGPAAVARAARAAAAARPAARARARAEVLQAARPVRTQPDQARRRRQARSASSVARPRSSGSCRSCRAAPRTTRC